MNIKDEIEQLKTSISRLEKRVESNENIIEKNLNFSKFKNCERPFGIGVYQVTQEFYEKITGKNPSYFKENPRYPVENVSHDEITNVFLPRLNDITGRDYRLPTEYEWLLAAQVDNTIYSGSDNIDEVAIYNANHPSNVGSKKPNSMGIYDMSGNVSEWCEEKVIKGGSWFNSAVNCRSAYRYNAGPAHRGSSIGFRLAITL